MSDCTTPPPQSSSTRDKPWAQAEGIVLLCYEDFRTKEFHQHFVSMEDAMALLRCLADDPTLREYIEDR